MSESIAPVTTDALLQFGGRLHPLVLHLPIGLLAGLVFFELLALVRRRPLDPAIRTCFAWLTAAAATVAVASGLLLGEEDGYSGATLDNHKLLGIALGIACLLAAIAAGKPKLRPVYAILLIAASALVVPAGHFGATMTHGDDFLFEPFRTKAVVVPGPAVVPAGAGIYSREIVPILASKCLSCHSEAKHKGGLALHTKEAIEKGGDFGPVVTPGHADASELVRRMRLPLDDEEHMPPAKKPQPSEEEIAAIERWIDSGAAFDDQAPVATAAPTPVAAPAKVELPSEEALGALRDSHVHVEFIDPGAGKIWVDFAAAAATDDAKASELLSPLKQFIVELSLAGTMVGDKVLDDVAEMKSLRTLDLSGTKCTPAGLHQLADLDNLQELRLTRTKLDDTAVEAIGEIASLKRVFLWNAGISAEGAEKLHASKPGLLIDVGIAAGAPPLETENAIKLTSDAPVPGAAPVQASLTPVNSVCPVSGAAVNPRYAVVHEGKVIGFCCEKCGAKFWEAPEKYPLK